MYSSIDKGHHKISPRGSVVVLPCMCMSRKIDDDVRDGSDASDASEGDGAVVAFAGIAGLKMPRVARV